MDEQRMLPIAGPMRKRRISADESSKEEEELLMNTNQALMETNTELEASNNLMENFDEETLESVDKIGKKRKSNDSEEEIERNHDVVCTFYNADADPVLNGCCTINSEQPVTDIAVAQDAGVQNLDNSANAENDAEDFDNFPFRFNIFDSDTDNSSSSSSTTRSIFMGSIARSSSSGSIIHMNGGEDTDSSEGVPIRRNATGPISAENVRKEVDEILGKPKPKYVWSSYFDIAAREHGLLVNGREDAISFNKRFYGSPHLVQRMELMHRLAKHKGCVNSLDFNRAGNLLASGGDDTAICIWDWAHKKPLHYFKSGHKSNVFQTKFVDGASGITIISASRDGMVRRAIVPSSGGKVQSSCLYAHMGAVHKIALSAQNPFVILSCGEDGEIKQKDLRSDAKATMLTKVCNEKGRKVCLFSISHNPYAEEVCVSGEDKYVRVYDTRNKQMIHSMCPSTIPDPKHHQVTCAVYNHAGNEILASYSDERIYLFDNKNYKKGEFLRSYRGHYNHRTIKGVNFYGPNSEYVVSGSDCGHIFFWDKKTEALMNMCYGDKMGVVNVLEPHPSMPILATSGLESFVKIWTPGAKNTVEEDKIKDILERNVQRKLRYFRSGRETDNELFFSFLRSFIEPSLRLSNPMALGGFSDSDGDSSSSENISEIEDIRTDVEFEPDDDDDGDEITDSDDDLQLAQTQTHNMDCQPQ